MYILEYIKQFYTETKCDFFGFVPFICFSVKMTVQPKNLLTVVLFRIGK